MKIKFFPLILIVIFLIIFFTFYRGLQNPNIYIPENNLNEEIPNFVSKVMDDDNKISSKKIFKGDQFYLINIWASWCIPCRNEHFYLMNLRNLENIEIIGINYKDKIENAKKFLKELDNPYKIVLLDKDGTIAIEWGAYGVPESFLVYNNKIIKRIIGPIDKNLLLEIKDLIK
jgi:cytochrome c biogenesis protein CcmG/thiol:disulfide interchange protein DsbE